MVDWLTKVLWLSIVSVPGLGSASPSPLPPQPPWTVRQDLPTEPDWRFAGFGQQIGRVGMASSRALGHLELYVTAAVAGEYWQVLRPEGTTRRLVQEHVSGLPWPPPPTLFFCTGLALGNVHPNPGLEIVTGYTHKGFQIYDQRSRELLATLPDIDFASGQFVLADLDRDGWDELVVVELSGVRVWSASGALLFDGTVVPGGYGHTQVVVGNMDDDPGPEIATDLGDVIDWDTRTLQCVLPHQDMELIALSDIDQDGRQELVGTARDPRDRCLAFDVEACAVQWSMQLPAYTTAMTLADVDGDGRDELLAGDLSGVVRGIDLEARRRLFSLRSTGNSVGRIFVEDVDSDGAREVLWGDWGPSNQAAALVVADPRTEALLWASPDYDLPNFGLEVGDVDGDGNEEIVTVNQGLTYSSESRVLVLDADTHALEGASSPIYQSSPPQGPWPVGPALRDVDADPEPEVLVPTWTEGSPAVCAYDIAPGGEITRKPLEYRVEPVAGHQPVAVSSCDAIDVDGDGQVEVVVGVHGLNHTNDVRIFDAASGALEWVSAGYSNFPRVVAQDLDADGTVELLLDLWTAGLVCLDAVTKQPEASAATLASSLSVETLPGDDRPTILVGEKDGRVRGFQHTGQSLVTVLDFHPLQVQVQAVGFARDRTVLVHTGAQIRWYRPGPTPTLLWQANEWGTLSKRTRFVWRDEGARLLTGWNLGLIEYRFD